MGVILGEPEERLRLMTGYDSWVCYCCFVEAKLVVTERGI